MSLRRLRRLRRMLALLALPLMALLLPSLARSQPAEDKETAPAIAPDSWAGQLETLSRWLDQHRAAARCTERCYTLDHLFVTGAVGEGPLGFELSGAVLADEPVAVPLFGPPAHVRVEGARIKGPGGKAGFGAQGAARRPGAPNVKDEGEPAAIGFEGDHYFVWTGARRFVLRGTLWLEGDLTLVIPGPLNAFEAEVTDGAVAEGARLSGLQNATLHFNRSGGVEQPPGPTVFQLSRAVRVSREISFEYRLVMRSGTDLGVVRLPLAFGEKVLDVTGATGWKAEQGELVLPTSGRTAEMTITGTLAKVGAFTTDARSAYEWWLLESDPEHRVIVKGDARQVDSAESPIPRTQATSRLLLVQKGQRVEVSVQPLSSAEVLAAVVRDHSRMLVLTQRGDLITDDTLSYENNGIDYLLYTPGGDPIYLATDGKSERIMRQGDKSGEILVPLQVGSHAIRVQSQAQAALRPLGGAIELPMPRYPLTSSHVSLRIGLPDRVMPLALLGGDRPVWFLGGGDAFAVALAFVAAWLWARAGAFRERARRRVALLGGAVLGGLWFLLPGLYVVAQIALAATGAIWLIGRFFHGARRVAATVVLLAGAGFIGLIALFAVSAGRSAPSAVPYRSLEPASDVATAPSTIAPSGGKLGDDRTGNFLAQGAVGGVLEGVTPVALSLPSYSRSVRADRELVTRDRAFRPILVYVTDWALRPLFVLWLVGLGWLGAMHRVAAAALYRRIVERLSPRPAEEASPDDEEGAEPPSA